MIAYYDAILAGIPAVMLVVIGIATMTSLGMQTGVGLAALTTLTLVIHAMFINPPTHTRTPRNYVNETEPTTATNSTK